MGMNKCLEAREKLGLSRTEFGVRVFGYPRIRAYNTIYFWETGIRNPSIPAKKMFDIIILLADDEDCKKALELILGDK